MVVRRKHIRTSRVATRIPKSLSTLESYYHSFRSARDMMDRIEVLERGGIYLRRIEAQRGTREKVHC